jgi:hypothetical protein
LARKILAAGETALREANCAVVEDFAKYLQEPLQVVSIDYTKSASVAVIF